ncbi:PREDICTED: uncharacterized protein LOC104816515 [Tarenaya hassleriana]|uniref:uncharacterized protein LOC104816515 n=1 Tax=Tarenaya hassleriana TaxID=28532 RepID=UPI00053C5B80|nr:PREDICTED: uncharacterized protein LOC104816515 [Tarenaya hassleriana]
MKKISGLLLILLLISVTQLASLSTARLCAGEIFPAIDDVIFAVEIPVPKEGQHQRPTVGCGDGDPAETSPGIVTGKYGSLVLNALPKRRVPASGPSKRTNDVKA